MGLLRVLPLALVLGLAAGAASSHDATSDDSTTLAAAMASGHMSQAAAEQFVATSGYSVEEAQDMTINEIGFIRWGND